MYNNELRGTELVKNNNIAVIRILNHTIYGYPLQMNVQYDQGMDKMATFSLAFLVTKHLVSLPGVVSTSQLETLYNASKGVPANEAAADAIENLQTVIDACSVALNVDKGSDFYGAQNVNNSLLHKSVEQMIQLINEGGAIEANFTSLQTTLQSYLATADGQISPFIAQVFGPTEEAIDTWFAYLGLFIMDDKIYTGTTLSFEGQTYSSPDEAIQGLRQRLKIIKDFMDSLQSNLLALQG